VIKTRALSSAAACVLVVTTLCVMTAAAQSASPLTIGEAFNVESKALRETRRVNVYLPPGYAESKSDDSTGELIHSRPRGKNNL